MKWLRAVGRFLRYITTARDNQTPDIIRVLGVLMGLQFIALAAWHVGINDRDFDPTSYGTGAGLLLAALGTAMRFARPTEPGSDNHDT